MDELFGHSVKTVERTVFGRRRVELKCPFCDLTGYVEGNPPEFIRGVVAVMVREHYRQTDWAEAKP